MEDSALIPSRILLIDDDDQVNSIMKAMLTALGLEVRTIEQPDGVDRLIADFQPHVVIVDYLMPGVTGLELLEEISRRLPSALRLLATGMADYALLKQAVAAGAWTVLSKPYQLTDLKEMLSLAELLLAAEAAEKLPASTPDRKPEIVHRGNESLKPGDLSWLIRAARSSGASADVAHHCLPIVASALAENARVHGARNLPDELWRIALSDKGESLELRVTDSGAGFDWRRSLNLVSTTMNKSRAAGLQLAAAAAGSLSYEDGGREAVAVFNKTSDKSSQLTG